MARRDSILVAASALVFALLAIAVVCGGPIWFDAPVRDALRGVSTPALTEAMRGLTLLGWDRFVIPLLALAAWRLETLGRRREAIALAAVVIGLEVLVNLLKLVFARERPEALYGYTEPPTASFPSGHAALSLGLYGMAAALGRGAARFIAAALLALLIGLSRVYLGIHYPSDIVAGYALALASLVAARALLREK